jgi:hypothetical protein
LQRTGGSISQLYYWLRAKRHSKVSVIGLFFQYLSNINRLTQCQENTELHCCTEARDLVHSTLKRKTKLLCTPYAILTTLCKFELPRSQVSRDKRNHLTCTNSQKCNITAVNIFVLQAYFFVYSCHFLILL